MTEVNIHTRYHASQMWYSFWVCWFREWEEKGRMETSPCCDSGNSRITFMGKLRICLFTWPYPSLACTGRGVDKYDIWVLALGDIGVQWGVPIHAFIWCLLQASLRPATQTHTISRGGNLKGRDHTHLACKFSLNSQLSKDKETFRK